MFSEKVETIGETVFYGSDKMDRVYFLSTTPPANVAEYALYNDRLIDEGTLYVPAAAKSAYTAKQWVVEREFGESMNVVANIVGMTDEEITALKARVTGIDVVGRPDSLQSDRCYDLQGRQVLGSSSRQQKGVYVVGARKVLK